MTYLIRIGIVAVIFLILSSVIKTYRPEYVFLIRITAVIIIFYISAEQISDFIGSFNSILSSLNVETEYFTLLIKIIGITLITDFISDTLKDNGETTMANTVIILSKFLILYLTMPALNSLLLFCTELIDIK